MAWMIPGNVRIKEKITHPTHLSEVSESGSYISMVELPDTVYSEIFARVLFSRNFAYAKLRENKILVKCQNHYVVY